MTRAESQTATAGNPRGLDRPPTIRVSLSNLSRQGSAAWMAFSGTGAVASVAVGLLVFSCVFLAVAAPRESLALRTRALRSELTHVGPLGKSVYAYLAYSAFEVVAKPVDGPALADAGSRLDRNLRTSGLPLAAAGADWSGLTTGFGPFTGAEPLFYRRGYLPPQVELLYRSKLPDHAKLIAGRLPQVASSSHGDTVFQVQFSQHGDDGWNQRFADDQIRAAPIIKNSYVHAFFGQERREG